MKNGLRVFFYLLAVATCLAAPNKAEAQVAEPLYHWRAAPGDTLMNSNPAAYCIEETEKGKFVLILIFMFTIFCVMILKLARKQKYWFPRKSEEFVYLCT